MTTEELQVIISAKISDFEKKMSSVTKKINTVQKGSTVTGKAVDKMLSSKGTTTNKAFDLIDRKLKQVNRTAAVTRKALASKMPLGIDNTSIDIQKTKLDQLRQKYNNLTSGIQVPASLKGMEREYSLLGTKIDAAKAKQAALNSEIEQLKWNEQASAGAGNIVGAEGYHAQILSAKSEMGALASSTAALEARAGALSSKMQTIRMNPSASPEAQLLAARIREADAKMQSLGNDTSKTTGKIAGLRSGGGALDAINRKISSLEKSSNRTANAVTRLGHRFLVLFVGKLITQAFKGIQDSLTGAATKSDDLQNSLNTLTSAGRTISNSVVAALAPLINVAAPMIDYISNKIMDFGNSVAMFFASISGQSTVLQATKAYAGFGAAAEGAGNSAAAGAEKAKNALAGFDQITKLDTSTSSSGSGGTGFKTAEGATSYVTVPVVQSELAKKVSDAIEKLKGPLSDFYENVLKKIGDWVMGEGVDLLATGLENIAQFFEDNPQLIDNLALFLATIVPLSALGPQAVVLGITVQATVAAIEWATGHDLGQDIATSFNSELWKSAGGGSIARGIWGWISDALLHGVLQKDYFKADTFAYAVMDGIQEAFNLNTFGLEGFAQLGENWATLIINGLIWGLNALSFPIQEMINKILGALNKDPISLAIDPIAYDPFYQPAKAANQKRNYTTDVGTNTPALNTASLTLPTTGAAKYSEALIDVATQTRKTNKENEVYSNGFEAVDEALYGTSANILGLKDSASSSSKGVRSAVNNILNPAISSASTYVRNGASSIVGSFAGIPASVLPHVNELNGVVSSGASSVVGSFAGIPTNVLPHINSLNGVVSSGVSATANSLMNGISGGVNSTVGIFSGLMGSTKPHLDSFGNSVSSASIGAAQSMINESATGSRGATGVYQGFSNQVTAIFETLDSNIKRIMTHVVQMMAWMPNSLSSNAIWEATKGLAMSNVTGIKMFARGGIVNSATAAIIGESGKEAVMPLERNTGWIDQLADKINSRGGGGSGDVYVTVQNIIDGEIVEEKVTKIQKRDARRSNKPVWGNA